MRRPALLLALVVIGLLAALAAKSWLVPLPAVRDVPAAGEFNAQRAFARLSELIAEERPHVGDTETNDVVRERIVAHLTRMGLEPQVRDAMACNELRGARGISCSRVRNIVATIGPPQGRHLLLNAHYDSSVVGPGAGDDGAGVATLLEVASLLRNEPLQRPVTLLFNEGEELGLIGARAFLAQDPLARRVDSLINLEARGTTGPVNMFETSLPNGAPIAAYSRAVERPVASSLATDFYRQLPNYTDVNIFSERGWTTLNLAMTGNETRYHSPGDDLAGLDLRSLQHMGDQTLSLARELSRGVPEPRAQRIFMDVLGVELITLPQTVGLILLGLLIAGFAYVGWRRRSFGRPLLVLVAALLIGTALAWGGEMLVGMLRPGMFWRAYPLWLHLAVYGSMAAAVLLVLGTFGRRIETERLRIAYWSLFLLIGAAVAFVATGGIIYFLLPSVPVLAAALAGKSARGAERLAALLGAALLFLTLGVTLAQVEELLNQGPMWLFAPLGALLIMPVLIEARPLIAAVRRSAIIIGSALLLAVGWSAAFAAPAYSADRQQRFSIEYVRAANGRSFWAIANDGVPLGKAFGEGWNRTTVPYSISRRWIRTAPHLPGTLPPAAMVVGSAGEGARRRVRLQLSANGADSIALVMPKDSRILAAGARGFVRPIPAGSSDDEYSVRCTGRSCDGLTLDLLVGRKQPVSAKVIGTRFGLPPQAHALVAARPKNARPQYSTDSVVTIGQARF